MFAPYPVPSGDLQEVRFGWVNSFDFVTTYSSGGHQDYSLDKPRKHILDIFLKLLFLYSKPCVVTESWTPLQARKKVRKKLPLTAPSQIRGSEGVASLGRVKWEVVSRALQQPLKASLKMPCCADWGHVWVHCAVPTPRWLQHLTAHSHPHPKNSSLPKPHPAVAVSFPMAAVHSQLCLCGCISDWVKKILMLNVRLHFKKIKINYSSYVFLSLSSLRSLQTEESTRQPELFKFSWRTEIWIVHIEGQIKFPGAAQDESRRSPSATHSTGKSLTACLCPCFCSVLFQNPSEMEQFEKATGDVGIFAKQGKVQW